MNIIDHIYIDGAFAAPLGRELFELYNPMTGAVIGQVRLGDAQDARRAIAAAKRALPSMMKTSKKIRLEMLDALHAAMQASTGALTEAMVEEFGAPIARASGMAAGAALAFKAAATTLADFEFERRVGGAYVTMEPVGVVGLITPWNSNAAFICNKLAYALAAGCTSVIKPSEMSATQTEVVLQALHKAGLPAGIYNLVNGTGAVVGAEITSHPDVAKISFTGSTLVGKAIIRAGAETLKRVTLELGGKSPTIILDDAVLDNAIPGVIDAGYANGGQACIAGTRVLVSERRVAEFESRLKEAVENLVLVGDPRETSTTMGPMVSQKQWDRIQSYLRLGVEEGARVLVGGEGHPEGLGGYFVRPTVFTGVTNNMRIAREEIFGPVLSIITYRDEEDAIVIANDSTYGLSAYVFGEQAHAQKVAARLESGRVVINGAAHEMLAPFGGVKQSGIGREFGAFGLEAHLEPRTMLGMRAG